MSNAGERDRRDGRPFTGSEESLAVLYVMADPDRHAATPSALEADHGMDVHVAPSVEAAVSRLDADEQAFDCLVSSHSSEGTAERQLLDHVQEHRPDLPFLVDAEPAEAHDGHRGQGEDPSSGDTDAGGATLLARRIEQCATSRRERVGMRQLRTAIDRMGHGLVLADADGRIEYVNRAFEAIGYTKEDVEGRELGVFRSAIRDEGGYRDLWETVTGGDRWCGELTVSGVDGGEHPVRLTATPIRDGTGDVQHIVAVGDDISERKRYERELDDARQKWRALIDAAPDAILVADAGTGEIVEANDSAAALLERPKHDVIGMHQTDLHPPEHRERYRELFERHLRAGTAIFSSFDDGEPLHVVTATGDRVPVEINAKRVELADRTLIQGHFRDISTRRERERDLRSFRQAVEQAGHVIMITDTDGRIEYVNPAFEAVTGYPEATALGERPSLLQSGEHDEAFYRDLWETITSGGVWEGELVNERKDGERYHIEQTIAPITDEEGTIERFVAVNTDITERKKREQQLERERDRLDEFASTVAHDLRNPLSIALGHADLLQETDDPQGELVERIVAALERMATMTDELLTLSKQGRAVLEPKPVRFDEVVSDAWIHVETPAATLTRDYEDAGWTLRADRSRLRELLENLFRNSDEHASTDDRPGSGDAVERGSTGGRPSSDAADGGAGPDVEIVVGRLSNGAGFYVEDDGRGIPPEDRNRIFESGFTTTDDGTGYGLAIVKQIVEAHGWEIAVRDADDGGARFEIAATGPDADRLATE